jgi:catechol 2,3-dioxygenase-like lactoylglutathione lyase family enzyme
MTMLRRVARNVSDLAAAVTFYEALGFEALGPVVEDAELAVVLGVERAISLRLVLGAQLLELTQFAPPGAAYPAAAKSNDVCFQHIAIVTRDIFAMHRRALRAGATAISYNGPQQLPKAAGGVFVWKFRDPERHPLEFLQMPDGGAMRGGVLTSGYDHSALCVTDVARSVRFYRARGLTLQHRHLNHGAAQARLDGLETSTVEVMAMVPANAPPHVELLGYRGMVAASRPMPPNDVAADRLIFNNPDGGLALQRDPDGHFLLLDGRD